MAFCCIFVPNFLLQAAIRCEPALWESPAALTDGTPLSLRVIAATKEALRRGVCLGMPQADATQISGLRFQSRSALLEQTAHEALLDIGWSISPQIEDTAADTILLDVSRPRPSVPLPKAHRRMSDGTRAGLRFAATGCDCAQCGCRMACRARFYRHHRDRARRRGCISGALARGRSGCCPGNRGDAGALGNLYVRRSRAS